MLLTDGPRTVTVVTATGMFEVAVPQVSVVDTVGAGDAFGGAFLARWIECGLERADLADTTAVREAVSLAVEVASVTCQRAGANPPNRDEAGWPPKPA